MFREESFQVEKIYVLYQAILSIDKTYVIIPQILKTLTGYNEKKQGFGVSRNWYKHTAVLFPTRLSGAIE